MLTHERKYDHETAEGTSNSFDGAHNSLLEHPGHPNNTTLQIIVKRANNPKFTGNYKKRADYTAL